MTEIASPTAAPQVERHLAGPVMVLAGGICIGFAPIGLRLGLGEMGPQAIALWRYVFAAPLLLGLVFLIERRAPRRPNGFVLLAGIFFAVDIGLWHWALTFTTVAISTFLVNLGNVCVGFVAWIFLRERPAGIWFIAFALAVGGAAALCLGGQGGIGDIPKRPDVSGLSSAIMAYRGELLAIGAAILVSGYMLCSKIARRSLGGIETIFWLTCVEILVAILLVTLSGESFWPAKLSGFAAPFFLALIVQVAGQGLIITGLGRTPAAVAGVLVVIQPVVAATISWQLFNEPLTGLQGAGAMLILFALWLAQRGKPAKRQTPAEQGV